MDEWDDAHVELGACPTSMLERRKLPSVSPSEPSHLVSEPRKRLGVHITAEEKAAGVSGLAAAREAMRKGSPPADEGSAGGE
jgi:hypothetical protein